MTYEQYGKIEAADIDEGLIGPSNAARINALWGTGYGNRGYGQSPLLPDVNVGDPIRATDWSSMTSLANQIAGHEGILITPDTFTPGKRVLYNNGLTKEVIDKIDSYRTSSLNQAPSANLTSIANNYGWYNKLTYTITYTFPDGDSARYYFNCGGQLAIRTWQPGINASGINNIRSSIAQLSFDMGTIYWSLSPAAGGVTKIKGVNYTATTKIGGKGTPEVLATGQDYYTPSTYSETNTPVTIFKQNVKNGAPGYDQSYISLGVYTTGDKGVNGANGNLVVFKLTVDVAPQSVYMPSGGIAYAYTVGPLANYQQTYLRYQSWATPTVDIIVTAT